MALPTPSSGPPPRRSLAIDMDADCRSGSTMAIDVPIVKADGTPLPPLRPLVRSAPPLPSVPPLLPVAPPPLPPPSPIPTRPHGLEAAPSLDLANWSMDLAAGVPGADVTKPTVLRTAESAPELINKAAGLVPIDPPPLPELAPRNIGPYIIRELIGEGGMGLVYRAEDQFLRRPAALKVMKADVARDERAWKLFLTEAQATASLKDDRIATIYQIGEDKGQFYLAMELLKGESLEARLRRAPMSIAQSLWVVREAAMGLAVAHAAGFIHRDIKPANLWLETTTGSKPSVDQLQKFRAEAEENPYLRVKILDFGLVRLEQDGDGRRRNSVVGTPTYMAPEQAAGLAADQRADIFSLGVVLYRLLTGRLPFNGQSTMEVLTALASETAPPVNALNANVPAPLVELVQRMLSRDPTGRPSTAADLARLIMAIERELTVPRERPRRNKKTVIYALAAMTAAICAFTAIWLSIQRRRPAEDVATVAPLTANSGAMTPADVVNAIGDDVLVEFTVGAIRRADDQTFLYEKPPAPEAEDVTFRVALPKHIIVAMRKRGSNWPDALNSAKLRLRGIILREGKFAEIVIGDLEQLEKILYSDKTNAKTLPKPREPRNDLAKAPKSDGSIGGDLPATKVPWPDTRFGPGFHPFGDDEDFESVERAANELLIPFIGRMPKPPGGRR